MAKALSGHLAVASQQDARLMSEVVRLRGRVRDLEAELARLEARSLEEETAGIAGVLVDATGPGATIQLDRATPAMR